MRLFSLETSLVLLVMTLPILGIGCGRAVSEVLPDEPKAQTTEEQGADETPPVPEESAAPPAAAPPVAAPPAAPSPAAAGGPEEAQVATTHEPQTTPLPADSPAATVEPYPGEPADSSAPTDASNAPVLLNANEWEALKGSGIDLESLRGLIQILKGL